MNNVNLLFNYKDAVTASLLIDFLSMLGGVYVATNGEAETNKKSVVNIYIVSKESTSDANHQNIVDIPKNILILKDGYKAEYCTYAKQIEYTCDKVSLLEKVVNVILNTIDNSANWSNSFFNKESNWKEVLIIYVKHWLLEASVIGEHCDNIAMYQSYINKYQEFIKDVDLIDSDLSKYVSLYAKYKASLIRKYNNYSFIYDPEELLSECNRLICKYSNNEQLLLLKAGIQFNLIGKWMDACDSYAVQELRNCVSAYVNSGKILKNYYKEYNKAIEVLNTALSRDLGCFEALYLLGDCLENTGYFRASIDTFKKIVSILSEKLDDKLLSPLEFKYLYNATMRVSILYKIRCGDYENAFVYDEYANKIKEENYMSNYITNIASKEALADTIFTSMKAKMNISINSIY